MIVLARWSAPSRGLGREVRSAAILHGCPAIMDVVKRVEDAMGPP